MTGFLSIRQPKVEPASDEAKRKLTAPFAFAVRTFFAGRFANRVCGGVTSRAIGVGGGVDVGVVPAVGDGPGVTGSLTVCVSDAVEVPNWSSPL